jgi:hypothetical protein
VAVAATPTMPAPAMSTFRVTAADGTVTVYDKHRPAMVGKVRAGPGATITVEGT